MPQHIIRFIIGCGVAFSLVFLLFAVMSAFHSAFLPRPGGNLPLPVGRGEQMCTMEAKLCPDGSAVGRSGPNCEFSPCPLVSKSPTTDFDRCVALNNPVMESLPRQCAMDGRIYTESQIEERVSSDEPQIFEPRSDAVVRSPLMVRGQAPGPWFFEGSFPVRLMDADGQMLASAPVQAQGEWMTTELVPFIAILSFSPPQTASGTLVLERDNPLGLPERAASASFPVTFFPPEPY